MKTMTLLVGLISIPNVVATAAGDLKPDPLGRMDRTISAYIPAGRMDFPTREILVEGSYPSGRPNRGNLLIVFDPSTGHFLWVYDIYWAPQELLREPGRLPLHELRLTKSMQFDNKALYIYKDQIVAFTVGGGPLGIYIRESAETAKDLNDAENRSVRKATAELAAFEEDRMHGWRKVELSKHFGQDFLSQKNGPSGIVGLPRLFDVARDDNWEIVLKGNWKAKITVNDKYDVVKVERVE